MNHVFKFSLIVTLLAGWFGCSGAATPAETAAEARVAAAAARTSVADAEARVTAADARVRVADAQVDVANADARVTASLRDAADATGVSTDVGAVIPSGTPFKVSLMDALDSDAGSVGDRFLASLTESIVVSGVTVLPAGTTLRGRVVDVERAGQIRGLAAMKLALTEIVQGSQSTSITTDVFAISSERMRDAETTAEGALGAAIGAAAGRGTSAGLVLATKGDEIHLDPGTRLTFTLNSSVTM